MPVRLLNYLDTVQKQSISIYEVVVAKFATTTEHGAIEGKSQTHDVCYYNPDYLRFIDTLNYGVE